MERFADIQLLRYRVEGFDALSPRQKRLVYYLSEAALAGRDILWDQNGRHNLAVRRALESRLLAAQAKGETLDEAFLVYLRRVWFANGIHHHYSMDKFAPEFSPALLEGYAGSDLLDLLFSPTRDAKRVNQRAGDDLLLTSACNYYDPSITQAEAEAFYAAKREKTDPEPPMWGLNSRLERAADGSLYEHVYKSGGLYGREIDHIIHYLSLAQTVAEGETQREVLRLLIAFYRTGDLRTFDRYTIAWLQDTESEVDFTNGFTEVYGDPLGLKGSWEGYVNIKDHEASRRTARLSAEAGWFEDHSPVAPQYKKPHVRGVSAKVVEAAFLGGDLYPASAIGINLPNSDWVRARHGSKSVTIGNLTRAYNEAARGSGLREEFVADKQTLDLLRRYDEALDDLHTDLHECLGHGSGRVMDGVAPDALGAYASTIEEARADLFALYYIADPKLVEMGLVPDTEAYRAQYYSYMMNGLLIQLARIEEGRQIEEAHMRNRALIARWCMERVGEEGMRLAEREGKTYLIIKDYARLRLAVAELLAEVQRIKSEGDSAAARRLVEDYGVAIDPALHSEIRRRYEALHIAPYKGFINPRYIVEGDRITLAYDEPYDQQMLRYGQRYQ